MLERVWRKENPPTLLVRILIGTDSMKNIGGFLRKLKIQLPYDPVIPLLGISQSVSSVTQLCPTLHNPMDCSTPGFPVHHQLPEPTQTHVHHVGDSIQASHLSSPSPPTSIFPSIRVFSNEWPPLIRWPKYLSLSFSISPSNKYSGFIFISFRID